MIRGTYDHLMISGDSLRRLIIVSLILAVGSLVIILALTQRPIFQSSSQEDEVYATRRSDMVSHQLEPRGIQDERVLEAMSRIPREKFVEPSLRDQAYQDHPLPIGEGQTISQPYVVALMTESLCLNGAERVLEIGTGSGYQAAVLAELTREVYTIEIRPSLAEQAQQVLQNLGYHNIHVMCADGYFGWSAHAPYDAIIITCAVNHIPPSLIEQLRDGGDLILPLGSTTYYQTLTLLHKAGGELASKYICNVRFVPMTGEAQTHGPATQQP